MCIIFFIARTKATDTSPYKFILASNRDEVYSRPTKSAEVWNHAKYVIGGQDLENGKAGGTWLGVSAKDKRIRIGALLNLPGEESVSKNPEGRGSIATNFLTGSLNNFDYSDSLLRCKVEYHAFNFVSIEFNENDQNCLIYHTSNAPQEIREFPNDQVHGFSNSPWCSPLKKVKHGKELFATTIAKYQTKEDLVTALMNVLKDELKFPDDLELKKRVPREEFRDCFSSIFVNIPSINYGSRTRTVILIDFDNKIDYYEETLLEDNTSWKRSHIQSRLE